MNIDIRKTWLNWKWYACWPYILLILFPSILIVSIFDLLKWIVNGIWRIVDRFYVDGFLGRINRSLKNWAFK